MSDRQPLPEYGEYATPEQQARAAGRPYVPPPIADSRVDDVPPPGSEGALAQHSVPRGSSSNRFVTMVMLVVGLVFLLDSVPGDVDFSAQLDATSKQFGIGKFAFPVLADRVGLIILAINVVVFVLTALWALRRLGRGKRSFYIPIIGFVVYSTLSTAATLTLFSADPAFISQLESAARSFF